MTEAGFRVENLQAVRAQLNDRLPKAAGDPAALQALGHDEIRTARADAECEARAHLVETVGRVQRSVERRVLSAADRKVVARYLAAKREVLD